jgi:HK97 family phage prohead protease
MKRTERLDVKATVSPTTEAGTFVALVSGWEADRVGDTIAADAFDASIAAWRRSGKQLPLLFEHGTEVVGSIDPGTMATTDEGLVCRGEVDRESEQGRAVWRAIKRGTAGFSIGFRGDSVPRPDGGRELTAIDLLEISVTSKPLHAATRALEWKGLERAAIEASVTRAAMIDVLAEAKGIDSPLKIATFEC